MSFNLRYRREKLVSNNFKPVIRFNLFEEEKYPEEYHPPIEEYKEEQEDLVIIDDDDEEEEETALQLEQFIKGLKKIKSVRRLELWIQQNRLEVSKLNNSDMAELLEFINKKYFNK